MVSLGRRIVLLRLGRFGRHHTSKKIATMLSLPASQREAATALCPHSIAATAGRIQASTQVILVSFSQTAEGWTEEEEEQLVAKSFALVASSQHMASSKGEQVGGLEDCVWQLRAADWMPVMAVQ
mmetsp:Transcript_73/g.168  ORF Transcript_73/g.168 Transcript_73/m.168 type:complete len:125 (+) Transcript_73:587-961(+)